MTPLIAALFDGPIDVVGDVHGELEVLCSLLAHLGYRDDGAHPDGRRLVFVGDLGDRGPDSPGVFAFVERLIDAGIAQCVLGNHELNLLRGRPKDGNGWFFGQDHDPPDRYGTCRHATATERVRITDLIARLPLVLERPDLRITHAAWDADAVAAIRRSDDPDVITLYGRHADRIREWLASTGLDQRAAAERTVFGHCLYDPGARLPYLEATGKSDLLYQMENPVRILTSGVERLADRPYFLAGRWRMVERVPWWRDYAEPVPVVCGHYWRAPDVRLQRRYARDSQTLFGDVDAHEWLGIHRRVFCVDFSIGGRHLERRSGASRDYTTRLGALRWPERELVFETGERRKLNRL